MKNLKYLFIAALVLFGFNACEDVPAPYDIPTLNGNGGTGGGESSENTIFEQNFSSSLGEFKQSTTNPDVQWVNDYSAAVITGHEKDASGQSVYKAVESYLVSPAFDLTDKEAAYITLNHVICYAKNANTIKENHQILASTDYTGDATKATWTVLDFEPVNSGSFTFADSYIKIPEELLGKSNVYLAAKYKSTTSEASTWEIKKIIVNEGEIPEKEEVEAKEMTVAEALAAYTGVATPAVVKAYIVGFIPDKSIDGASFSSSATSKTNIIIADTPDETDINKCMPVQLPSGDIRNKVNLQDNPANYKKIVTLTGSLEKYFGVAGLKSVSKALFEGESSEDESDKEPAGKTYINETFATDLGSFTTAQMVNDYAWKHEEYNGKGYAKVSGYADGASQDAESWLISPAMDFSKETAAIINFDYVINKGETSLAATNHKLMITSEYTGNYDTTTWEELDFGAENDGTWTFRNSGNIEVPAEYLGKEAVVIAFKYVSTTAASSTWEVMNVVVAGETGGNAEEGDTPAGGTLFEQDFTSSLGEFTQTNSSSELQWINDYSSAVVKGYDNGTYNAGESYFVSPAINLSGVTAAHVTIEHVICYANNATINNDHQLLISTDYTDDATAATWTTLDFKPVGSTSFTFKSVSINIPAEFAGKENVYIAFKYTSTDTYASTWEVKSIKVQEGECKEEEEGGNTPLNDLTVAQALAAYTGTATPAVIKGYIVGFIPDKSIDGALFNGSATSKTNIIIADTPDETDINKCMPVQLPSGDVRNKVNLQDNPANYKKFVTLTGSLEKYFGVAGLKSVSQALFEGESSEDEGDKDNEQLAKTYIDEAFATDLGSFTTAQMVNDYAWKHEEYNGKGYAKVSGYADGASQDAESWLISPAMDFSKETAAIINFDYVINKGETSLAATNHKLMITSEYTGNYDTTTWEELDFGAENDGTWTFRNSGNIEVPAEYLGKEAVVIAFKYVSTTAASSTWEVNNLLITGEVGGSVNDNTGDNEQGGDEPGTGGEEEDTPTLPEGVLSVSQAIAAYVNGEKQEVTVTGYIVGYATSGGGSFVGKFTTEGAAASNMLIAATPDETDSSKCIPVQLPSNSDTRAALNLKDNPGNLGKKVTLTGSLEAYFSAPGLKTPTAFTLE